MIPAETIREMLAAPEQNKPLEELLADKRVMLYDLCKTALELYAMVSELEKERETTRFEVIEELEKVLQAHLNLTTPSEWADKVLTYLQALKSSKV